MKNWKTTLAGVLTFLLGGATALWPQNAALLGTLASIAASLGLMAAGDAKKGD